MVLKWRFNEVSEQGMHSMGIPEKIQDTLLDYNTKNIFNEPVLKHVVKKERFCPHCNNPESHLRNIRKLKRFLNKDSTKVILNAIENNRLEVFDKKQIIALTKATNLTDGSLQGKILSILCILGYVKITRVEWKDKNGKVKYKNAYLVNKIVVPPKCYNSEKDSHIDNWKEEGIETRYFQK